VRRKLVLPGRNRREQFRNNWRMWGPRGLLTTHGVFEWGIAILLKPFSSKKITVGEAEINELRQYGVIELFRRKAKEIAALGLYDAYQRSGWTPALARQARRSLIPVLIQMVALAWYAAVIDAGLAKKV